MVVLTEEEIGDVHVMLPDGFRRSMSEIKNRGGPWECDTCGGPSYVCYRCSKCGADLV